MNQSNYHVKKRIGYLEAALLGNFIYIVAVLLFKTISNLMGNSGNYNIVFGTIFFGLISAYLIGFNWLMFRKNLGEKGYYTKYILSSMLPIFVLMVISIIVITLAPSTSFGTSWSEFTFLVAPTIFWFLPYGLVFHFIGNMVPMVVFFIICFVYIVVLHYIGIALGSRQRSKLRVWEEKRTVQRQVTAKKVAETYSQPEAPLRAEDFISERGPKKPVPKRKAPVQKKINTKDPFDEGDQTQIIYTEAFSIITDEMIAEADERKRQNLERKMEKAVPMTPAVKELKAHVEEDMADAIDMGAVERAILESQKAIEKQVSDPVEKKRPLEQEKSETQNISEELEQIRALMSQKDKKKRQ